MHSPASGRGPREGESGERKGRERDERERKGKERDERGDVMNLREGGKCLTDVRH